MAVIVVAVLVRRAQVRMSMAVAHLIAIEVFDVVLVMMRVEVLAPRRILAMPAIVAVVVVIDVSPEM
jgi:hypothetical protein